MCSSVPKEHLSIRKRGTAMPRLYMKVLGKTFENRNGNNGSTLSREDHYIVSCFQHEESFLGFSYTRRRHNASFSKKTFRKELPLSACENKHLFTIKRLLLFLFSQQLSKYGFLTPFSIAKQKKTCNFVRFFYFSKQKQLIF